MSLVDTQRSIEYMYDKKRISKMVREDILDTPELINKIDSCVDKLKTIYMMGPHFTQKGFYTSRIHESNFKEAIYRILEVVMVKPSGVTFSSVVGQSASVFNLVSKLDSFKIISSVISYMYYSGIVRIIRAGDAHSGMMEVVPVYICDAKILKFISQTKYLPPMVCAPRQLKTNSCSAYLTENRSSVILKSYNHHEKEVCLDSLNLFNSVALSLDIKMLTTFDEEPKKVLDTEDKKIQFDNLRKNSYEVFKMLIQSGNNFHLTHKYDKRGRTYAQGYHCSTQGNSFRKAIINLNKKELVYGNFT